MKGEFQKLNDKGVKPVVIIDELQALDPIYMNGQRESITELFNFFVAIIKKRHLAHVIISSSDGYFIDTVYKDYRLTGDDIEKIWDVVGGSMWEIQKILLRCVGLAD